MVGKRSEDGMRHLSKKRAKQAREEKDIRNEYQNDNPVCHICVNQLTETVHEMTSGSLRKLSTGCPETWLAVCGKCHREIHDTADWPIQRQLAYKLTRDPLNFSLGAVNKIRKSSHGMVYLEDIVSWLEPK